MFDFLSVALSALLLSNPAPSMAPPTPVPIEEWQAHAGDSVLIDTESNSGYLLRLQGDSTLVASFPVVTGQRRYVRYIGRGYNATTPVGRWTVLSEHIKGDRVTFGPTGRFLRLYRDGQENTAYGIHSHRSADMMLGSSDRYRSMGCVIISEDVLNILEEIYKKSGDRLEVVTQYGTNPALFAQR